MIMDYLKSVEIFLISISKQIAILKIFVYGTLGVLHKPHRSVIRGTSYDLLNPSRFSHETHFMEQLLWWLLRISMAPEVTLIGYALVMATVIAMLEVVPQNALHNIVKWLESRRHSIVPHKMEAVLLIGGTGRKMHQHPSGRKRGVLTELLKVLCDALR